MGVQIPRGVHSQVPQEDSLCRVAATPCGGVSQTRRAKGKQDRGRPSPTGSRAYVDFDPTQTFNGAGDRVYQGKERDTLSPCVRREEAEFRRSALLGQRILRIHSRTRHRGHTGVYQEQEEKDRRLEQLNLWR